MDGTALDSSLGEFPNIEACQSGTAQVMLGGSMGLSSSDMLQNMLIDERMRCEHHRTNYQTLKTEHKRLQVDYTQAQNELKRMLTEKQTAQENLQLLMAELRGELLDKTREVEELKLQVITPQRLELLKTQVQQEMEAPIREHFSKLEEEAEKYRSEYNKLRYEIAILKSEFDHQQVEHERILEERKMRYATDLARLEREMVELSTKLQRGDPVWDGKRVEALLMEKTQLHQRLRGLEAEVTELHAQKENTGAQAENAQRIQLRQLAESQAALKALESEKQSVRLQLERVEKELRSNHEQNIELTGKLHKAEREISALNNQIDEIRHAHKLELTNVKLECLKAREEVEKERDILQTKVESLKSDLEGLKASMEKTKELLLEKELEIVRSMQGAREEEMQKMSVIQAEKVELQNCLSKMEQQRALQEATENSKRQELMARLHAAQLAEEDAHTELQNIKAQLQQQGQQLEESERQKTENTELRQQNTELNLQISALSHSERELMDANGRLRESLEIVREELRSARTQMERSQQETERLVEDRYVEWLEEKHKLQERLSKLQEKHNQAKERLQKAAIAQKKRKNITEVKEKKLQDKIQLLEAKTEELEIENRLTKKNPPFAEEYAQLSRRLKELQKRHNEFSQLLLGNHMTSMPLPSSLLIAGPESSFPSIQDEQHQRELAVLRRRLEELENSQQQQLLELTPPLNWDKEKDRERFPPSQDSLTNN